MNTQLIPAPATPETPTIVTALQAAEAKPAESGLPQTHHDAYRMKLAGKPVQEIADSFSVDRVTIWRWCKAVEAEAISQLANQPVINLISEEANRLRIIEVKAMEGAEKTTSDRARAMYLAEARRAVVSRYNLLLSVGVFPKAPEQIYQVTADMKPQDQKEKEQREPRDRDEAIQWFLEKLKRARPDI